jgi:hypothetical protein
VGHIHDLAALALGARRAAWDDGLTAVAAARLGVSHFNRLFRSRFGDTPSGIRAPR